MRLVLMVLCNFSASVKAISYSNKAECAFRSMSVSFIPRWDFSQLPASTDYKVIAFRMSMGTLRESFRIHSPLKFEVTLFCEMILGDNLNAIDKLLEINFDVACCQGFLINPEEGSTDNRTRFIVETAENPSTSSAFIVELLDNYRTVCSECGMIREQHPQSFRLHKDLSQIALRWTYVNNDPHFMVDVLPDNSTGPVNGTEFWVLKGVTQQLNTSFELVKEPNEAYGSFNDSTKTWEGMINLLYTKEVDFAFTELTPTEERLRAVDFSYHFHIEVISFIARKPREKSSIYTMAWAFDGPGWALIAGSMLLTSSAIHLVAAKGEKEPSSLQPPGYIVIIALFLRQNHSGYQELTKLSYKILLISWCLFSVVITNAFSGSILAFLNIRLHEQPIDTFEALARALRRSETKAGTYGGTLMADMIAKPQGNQVAMLINKLLKVDPTLNVGSPVEGVAKVLRQKYVYIDSRTSLISRSIRDNIANKVLLSKDFMDIASSAFALQKKCFLNFRVNSILMRLVQSGLYHKYYNDALHNKGSSKDGSDGFRELRITDCLGHTAVLGGGVTVSALVFFCELCASKVRITKESTLNRKSHKKIDDPLLTRFHYKRDFILRQHTHLNLWKDSGGYRYELI